MSDRFMTTDASLFDVLETGNLEKLRELQQTSERQSMVTYFTDKLTKIYNKLSAFEPDDQPNNIIEVCKSRLYDIVITIGEFVIEKPISFGGYSTVYQGMYKYLDVAIKKISLSSLNKKQLVCLKAINFERTVVAGTSQTSEHYDANRCCN